MQVTRTNAKKPGRIKLKDFIMKFTEPKAERKPLTEEEKRRAVVEAKARWLGNVGLTSEGKSR
jgi:hypothetical protein